MPRPCHDDHPLSPATCHLCWLATQSPEYAGLWGEPIPPPRRPRPRNCIHLGEATGELVRCPSCRGHVELKAFACDIHGSCLPWNTAPGVRSCLGCSDRAFTGPVPQAGQVRHLLYHLYPHSGNGGQMWRENLELLKRRLSLFNGVRSIGVATDPSTNSLADVQAALEGCDCQFVHVRNVRELREVTTHVPLLETLARFQGPGDTFLFGHGKGATSQAWAAGIGLWREHMLRLCCDYWPVVRGLLCRFPTVGPFKRIGRAFPECPASNWHFSGSWRWTRNRDLFTRDWRGIEQAWIGVEAYPSLKFEVQEAASLGHEITEAGLALYVMGYWEGKALPDLWRWYEAHYKERQNPMLLSCILTSHRKPVYVHEAIRSVLDQDYDGWQLLIIDSGDLIAELEPYAGDARVSVIRSPSGERCQGWQYNHILRSGQVRGDVVHFMTDDDVLQPHAFREALHRAQTWPEQSAWFGMAHRFRVHPNGAQEVLGVLPQDLAHRRGRVPMGQHIDGGQVFVRRDVALSVPWSEKEEDRPLADAEWMDRVGELYPLIPLDSFVLDHRHTPESCFTQ